MKEEYSQYKKSIKRKHSFGLWNLPAYQEDFTVSVQPRIALFIFSKVLEELEWGIGELNDELLTGANWNKKGNILQNISISYKDPLTIQIRSESVNKNLTDGGENYKNVQLLLYVYQKLTKGYTHKEYEEIEDQINRRNNWDNYEIPDTLPAPAVYKEPQKQKFIIGLTALFLPVVFSGIIFPLYISDNWGIAFEVLWAFAVIYLLKYLFRWSFYYKDSKAQTIAYILLAGSFIINVITCYQVLLIKEMDPEIEGLIFWEQFLISEFNGGVLFSVFLLKMYPAIIFFMIPYFYLPLKAVEFERWLFPEEVLDMVYYFKIKKKKSDEFVKTELFKRGWTDPVMQKMVIELVS